MTKIAFDIDGTLMVGGTYQTPNFRVLDVLRWFISNGDQVFVWSGGGVEYAEQIVRKLGLNVSVIRKGSEKMDVSFDDEEVNLASVNIKV